MKLEEIILFSQFSFFQYLIINCERFYRELQIDHNLRMRWLYLNSFVNELFLNYRKNQILLISFVGNILTLCFGKIYLFFKLIIIQESRTLLHNFLLNLYLSTRDLCFTGFLDSSFSILSFSFLVIFKY